MVNRSMDQQNETTRLLIIIITKNDKNKIYIFLDKEAKVIVK